MEGQELVFVHTGWGKIRAAAATQWAIDRWQPRLVVNLGTCGGFAGEVTPGEIMLAERTVVYDILDRMGNADAAVRAYSVELDHSWLRDPLPLKVRRTVLVSADRDLVPEEIAGLQDRYGAVAGDWESGAIAYVATQNRKPCLILRGVTDLVGPGGGEADGHYDLFAERAKDVMGRLLGSLPQWLEKAQSLGSL